MADWKKNSLHDLHIDSYTAQGFGVARLDGRVVFIPGHHPGRGLEGSAVKGTKEHRLGPWRGVAHPLSRSCGARTPHQRQVRRLQYRHMTYEEELTAKWDRGQ